MHACPPARMQRLAREIIQSKECWISCCSFAATTCYPYRYCKESLSVLRCRRMISEILSRVEISFNKVWTQNNACITSSNQPTNWNNNREKMVTVIQLVLIEPFQLILGGSKSVCLRLSTVISANIAWKCTRHISKFKLNIVEYTVTYLSIIALLVFESWWIKLSYFFLPHPVYKFPLYNFHLQATRPFNYYWIEWDANKILILTSGEASPTIWSCYANISVFIDRENNSFLKKWIMVTKFSGWLRHWYLPIRV